MTVEPWMVAAAGAGYGLWQFRHQLLRSAPWRDASTRRYADREWVYRIAVRAFGGLKHPEGDATAHQRTIYRETVKTAVKVHQWSRDAGVSVFHITHGSDVDVSEGSKARRLFESLVRENLRCPPDRRWTFAWPQGAHYVIARQEPVIPDDVARTLAVVSTELGATIDPTAATITRGDQGAVVGVAVPVPVKFPVARVDQTLAVQATIDARVPSPTGAWRHQWEPKVDRYRFDAAQPLPARAVFDPAMVEPDARRFPFAVTHGGDLVYWDTAVQVHALIAGVTGAGKTTAARVVVLAWMLAGGEVLGVGDPKNDGDWAWFEAAGGRVETTPKGIHALIVEAEQFMRGRSRTSGAAARRKFTHRTAGRVDHRPALVYVDEWADVAAHRRGRGAAAKVADETCAAADRIAALGRAPAVHLCLATQRPDRNVVDGGLKHNLSLRAGFGAMNGINARIVFLDDAEGDLETGRDVPRGRGYVTSPRGLVEAQGLWVDEQTAFDLVPATVSVTKVERDGQAIALPATTGHTTPTPTDSEPPAGDTGVRRSW